MVRYDLHRTVSAARVEHTSFAARALRYLYHTQNVGEPADFLIAPCTVLGAKVQLMWSSLWDNCVTGGSTVACCALERMVEQGHQLTLLIMQNKSNRAENE